MPGLVAVFVIVAFVMGAYWNAGRPEREAIELVKRSLRDPDSAKFRNVAGSCGEVNAKNAYGAMAGFEPFHVHSVPGKSPELIMGKGSELIIAIECKHLAKQ